MNNPLVSVCIPAYNIENHLESAIKSVLGQTYTNIEVIVVDDGSTDDTLSVAKRFEGGKVKVIHQKNSGASAARNRAYNESKGDYIKFLDGDDVINPEMIETQVRLASQNPGCVISGKWGRFYNNDLNTFKLSPEECWKTLPSKDWLVISWKNGRSMTQSGIFLLPKKLVDSAGLWDETLSLIDDLDFFTRIIVKSERVVFDQHAILYYRSGLNGSLSTLTSETAVISAFKSIGNSVERLLEVNSSKEALLACANVWQSFIYFIYPDYPQFVEIAEKNVKKLKGADLEFRSGGITKILVAMLGWKITKRLKTQINRVSFPISKKGQ